ncbi:MAG: hypothetical protein H0S85_11595, partial [Desulfovibrionaceae bacterium]|nr:hypothetical protein [Desulfovibrionaceae bacterium]
MSKYIELDRRYYATDLEKEEDFAVEQRVESMTGEGRSVDLGGLLTDNRLSVVFGEARSGKTTEFKEWIRRGHERQEDIFFAEVHELASAQPSRDALALAVGDFDRLAAWWGSTSSAVFLLDAVDESKLLRQGKYGRALDGLAMVLEAERLGRVTVCLSCRRSAWDDEQDKPPLLRLAARMSKGGTEVEPSYFTICPLDEHRIRLYARAVGTDVSTVFFSELDRAKAWEFASRPGDVEALLAYWKRVGRIGNLTELVEEMVARHLSEANPTYQGKAPPPDRLRQGAEKLAAASILCGQPHIMISLGAHEGGLNPFDLLTGWELPEVQALLHTGMFDSPIIGRVGFHTRTLKEYLAACWLRDCHARGADWRAIRDILFARVYGHQVLRPSLAAVAAWVAPHSEVLLRHIIEHAPEVLPDMGDPQKLPVELRAEILRAHARKYAGRNNTGLMFDRSRLASFGSPELVPVLDELLADRTLPEDSVDLCLDVAQAARLSGCSRAVMDIFSDDSVAEELRITAMRTLRVIAGAEELQKVLAHIMGDLECSPRFLGVSVECLYPLHMSERQLLEIVDSVTIEQTGALPHDFVSWAGFAIKRMENAARLEALGKELTLRIDLHHIESALNSGRYRGSHLYSLLIYVAGRLIEIGVGALSVDWILQLCAIISFFHDYEPRDEEAAIVSLVTGKEAAAARKVVFNNMRTINERVNSKEDGGFIAAKFFHTFTWYIEDIEWVLEEVEKSLCKAPDFMDTVFLSRGDSN